METTPYCTAWRVVVANESILRVRETEIAKVIQQDKSIGSWMTEAARSTKKPVTPIKPVGYIATDTSHLHLEFPEEGVPLCKHKQGGGAQRRLANPRKTRSRLEAIGWERPICEGCFSRASARYFPA